MRRKSNKNVIHVFFTYFLDSDEKKGNPTQPVYMYAKLYQREHGASMRIQISEPFDIYFSNQFHNQGKNLLVANP